MEAPDLPFLDMDAPAASALCRLDAIVRGRVQGVGFRAFTRRHARRLGLNGHVRNEPDGSVAVVAEGQGRALGELVRALHDGPPAARVDDVVMTWGKAEGACGGFVVEYAGMPIGRSWNGRP